MVFHMFTSSCSWPLNLGFPELKVGQMQFWFHVICSSISWRVIDTCQPSFHWVWPVHNTNPIIHVLQLGWVSGQLPWNPWKECFGKEILTQFPCLCIFSLGIAINIHRFMSKFQTNRCNWMLITFNCTGETLDYRLRIARGFRNISDKLCILSW